MTRTLPALGREVEIFEKVVTLPPSEIRDVLASKAVQKSPCHVP